MSARVGDVVVQVAPPLVRQVVLAVGLPVPDRVPVARERLVQPDRGEGTARHEVAEPVVRELVRDRVLVGPDRIDVVEVGRGIGRIVFAVEVRLAEPGRGRRFHGADREFAQRHRVVLDPGIGVAHLLREELDHLSGVAEREPRGVFRAGRSPGGERHRGPADFRRFELRFREVADVHRHQIVGDRLLLDPVEGARPAGVLLDAFELPVGDGREPFRDRHEPFDREPVVGVVVERQPAEVEAPLAVVPGLRRPGARRREEVHADFGTAGVGHGDRRSVSHREGRIERDVELPVLLVEAEDLRLSVPLDFRDREVGGVERERRERRAQREERHGRRAGDLFLFHVERELRLVALDVVRPLAHRALGPFRQPVAGQHLRGAGERAKHRQNENESPHGTS